MNYAKAIRIVRASRNMSQQQVANIVGVDNTYISRIEGGSRRPTIELLVELLIGNNE